MTQLAANDSDPIAWTGQSPVFGRGTQAGDGRMNPYTSDVCRAANWPPGRSAGEPEALFARITP